MELTPAHSWLSARDAWVVGLPTLVLVGVPGVLLVGTFGLERLDLWWDGLGTVSRAVVIAGLTSVLALASVLLTQLPALAVPVLSGDWGTTKLGQRLHGFWSGRLARKMSALEPEDTSEFEYRRRFETFPGKAHVRPTRLGNILGAGDYYVRNRYRMDPGLFWPRLYPFLDSSLRDQLSAARAAMELRITLLVVFMITAAGAVIAGPIMGLGALAVVTYVGLCSVAARCLYLLALPPAKTYAMLLGCAFDLYRREIFSAVGLDRPHSLAAEAADWKALEQYFYRGSVSDDASNPFFAGL